MPFVTFFFLPLLSRSVGRENLCVGAGLGEPPGVMYRFALCVGAVDREGRGAPVRAPVPSGRGSSEKHMAFGALFFLTIFRLLPHAHYLRGFGQLLRDLNP